ncbi:hypothetical protein BKA70DRAFT_1301139 [Coprinopsis sp. MPI-PUGE-AT-0042]|nr:hypothetical protein BKA70DRAFT_1301139 [Coprinopsis sp. MPI-PUGE-AT-0042]
MAQRRGKLLHAQQLQGVCSQRWSNASSILALPDSTSFNHKKERHSVHRVQTKASQTMELSSASAPGLPPSASPPSAELLIAMSKLEVINQLIAPHTDAIGIFRRVKPYLRDLTVLVGFASTAYTACGSGTILGNIVRASIDTRMKNCSCMLSQLLRQIARLPHRWFPRTRYAFSVVHQWWTRNEPGEIRAIHLSIVEEATAVGRWLRCLHSG